MKKHVMGIDFGSTTAKAVIVDMRGRIIAWSVSHMGAVSDAAVHEAVADVLTQASLKQEDMGRCVSTGYGRRMLDIADKNFTEITCHARGAVAMVPEARLVIDIGGQDSKTIAVDANGLVAQFAMNDRCAAGTGKFLEVLARAMEIELEEMGDIAMKAQEELKISSMCATFAETEVISLRAEGHSKENVLGAVHQSIATRTLGLVNRVGKKGPAVMTGGVARNKAAVHYIEKVLGIPLILPETPQIAGALGAALIGLDDYKAELAESGQTIEEDYEVDAQMAFDKACVTGCKGDPAEAEKNAPAVTGKLKSMMSNLQKHF
ncbi:MAG: 2-hydroxyglutaryl-CoA dehydratase [Novosphingobium sp.]|nr:2-hydroxyglutaryl-CoA dehydratase [Novosphingobium sp.]MCP5389877.1 2-hydroxyglutaryl-CoA dehydratase [Novosphingobium sp.]